MTMIMGIGQLINLAKKEELDLHVGNNQVHLLPVPDGGIDNVFGIGSENIYQDSYYIYSGSYYPALNPANEVTKQFRLTKADGTIMSRSKTGGGEWTDWARIYIKNSAANPETDTEILFSNSGFFGLEDKSVGIDINNSAINFYSYSDFKAGAEVSSGMLTIASSAGLDVFGSLNIEGDTNLYGGMTAFSNITIEDTGSLTLNANLTAYELSAFHGEAIFNGQAGFYNIADFVSEVYFHAVAEFSDNILFYETLGNDGANISFDSGELILDAEANIGFMQNVSMNSKRIGGLAPATAGADAVNLNQLLNAVQLPPAGTEIDTGLTYSGKNVFAGHFVGNVTKEENITYNLLLLSGVDEIVNSGGYWVIRDGIGIPKITVNSITSDNCRSCIYIYGDSLFFETNSVSARTSRPFDIWALYTKI